MFEVAAATTIASRQHSDGALDDPYAQRVLAAYVTKYVACWLSKNAKKVGQEELAYVGEFGRIFQLCQIIVPARRRLLAKEADVFDALVSEASDALIRGSLSPEGLAEAAQGVIS